MPHEYKIEGLISSRPFEALAAFEYYGLLEHNSTYTIGQVEYAYCTELKQWLWATEFALEENVEHAKTRKYHYQSRRGQRMVQARKRAL